MQPQTKTSYTIDEFSSKYGINRSTFYRNAKKGKMPPYVKLGRSSRILVDDEQAWLAAYRRTAPMG